MDAMIDPTLQEPAFSARQLSQLTEAIRPIVRQEVRAAIEEEVDPKFTAIQQDLTELKDGQARIEAKLYGHSEASDERYAGLDSRVQSQLDNHEDRLAVLEKQPA
ncbi:hypothetical protein HY375_00560 [Candidatus Berkelbacteria bacterium]|nr:hypothetical protein [Candidatus Berkelbacteria bacterium]